MKSRPSNVIPFSTLTLSDVLEQYEEVLQHHDIVIGLADGNVRIKQKQADRNYEVLCNENDLTISSTLHGFLEN